MKKIITLKLILSLSAFLMFAIPSLAHEVDADGNKAQYYEGSPCKKVKDGGVEDAEACHGHRDDDDNLKFCHGPCTYGGKKCESETHNLSGYEYCTCFKQDK